MSTTAAVCSNDEQGARQIPQARLTVELGLYGLSFGLALALRLLALERWPLLDQETGLALAAWRLARGLPTVLRGHSPLLFHANTLWFFLTGGSDLLARSWCVLFGSLLVLLPYGLRHRLGRVGALAASLLLAISPSFVYFSRSVDGSIIVAFCALGLLVVLANYLESRRDVDLPLASGLLVLALLAAPSAYTLLAILLTFGLFLHIWARFRDKEPLDDLKEAWNDACSDSQARRWALNAAFLLVLGLGLAFAFNVAGLQMALDQLGQWLAGFHFFGQPSWYLALLLLFLYEGLPLFFGLAGFFVQRSRGDVWNLLLRYWLIFALLFSIVPGYRPTSSVLLILLPLILSTGWAVDKLGQELRGIVRQPLLWVLVAVTLVVSATAYLQLVHYLSLPQTNQLLRMAALGIFALSSYALVWSLSGSQLPLRAAMVSLLLLLWFGCFRAGVRLNYDRARDPLEPMVGVATSPQVLELAREASQLSSHLHGDARVLAWQVEERLEIPLGWYLRDFEQVSYLSRVPPEPDAPGVIALAGVPGPSGYVGLRYALRSFSTTLERSPIEWLRWWTGYKSGSLGQQTEHVVLWVRKSLQ